MEEEQTNKEFLFEQLWAVHDSIKKKYELENSQAMMHAVEVAKLIHFEDSKNKMDEFFVKFKEATAKAKAYEDAAEMLNRVILHCKNLKL